MNPSPQPCDGVAIKITEPITIGCPTDAVAAVQEVLGFQPRNTLVILGWNAAGSFAVLMGLPDTDPYTTIIQPLQTHMITNRADAIVLLGFGTEQQTAPLLHAIHRALNELLTVKEVLLVRGAHWRSALCTNLRCCPPQWSE